MTWKPLVKSLGRLVDSAARGNVVHGERCASPAEGVPSRGSSRRMELSRSTPARAWPPPGVLLILLSDSGEPKHSIALCFPTLTLGADVPVGLSVSTCKWGINGALSHSYGNDSGQALRTRPGTRGRSMLPVLGGDERQPFLPTCGLA